MSYMPLDIDIIWTSTRETGPGGYQTFFMLNSTEHEISTAHKRIPKSEDVSCFKSLRCGIYHAYKCLNANKCWHFNIYEQDKFLAQLS